MARLWITKRNQKFEAFRLPIGGPPQGPRIHRARVADGYQKLHYIGVAMACGHMQRSGIVGFGVAHPHQKLHARHMPLLASREQRGRAVSLVIQMAKQKSHALGASIKGASVQRTLQVLRIQGRQKQPQLLDGVLALDQVGCVVDQILAKKLSQRGVFGQAQGDHDGVGIIGVYGAKTVRERA